jgi:[ribosomal protein S18]-alanine N-acetyltransferase
MTSAMQLRGERRDYDIVQLTVDDLEAIDGVMQSSFDPQFGEAWNKGQCLGIIGLPGYHVIGAVMPSEQGKVLIGFAFFRIQADESELLLLAVAPHHRRNGVGDALVSHWYDQCCRQQVIRLFLEMRRDNPAAALYSKMGFTKVGERPNYYRGTNGEMRDALTFARDAGVK